jgi:hypothetical protein
MNHITTCPHCSKRLRVSEQITDKTLICPHCLANVDNPRPGVQIQAPDLDTCVKRDVSVGTIVLAVLIGFCLLGIAIAFLYDRVGGRSPTDPISFALLMVFIFSVLEVLVSIAIVHGLVHWGTSGNRGPSIGRVFGITLLSLVSISAAVIFLFFTCVALVN